MISPMTRRAFVASAAAAAVSRHLPSAMFSLALPAPRSPSPHPTPRKGITSARVAKRSALPDKPAVIELFDGIRAIPEIVDGIRCNCGCAETEGFYSLLSCYEGDAMAMACVICQGQGRLVVRLRKSGKTLDEIRTAVDAQFG